MYGLYNYGELIADEGRTRAYAESLKRHVTPASVVVDIGTGTGIFALLAARLGARKVYAIESSDAITFGRPVAAQNGLDRRVEFIQGVSTHIQLPEKADLIVSEIHGVLPAYRRSLFSIMDARDRFLAPTGCLIPRRETLWAALVEAATLHQKIAGVWGKNVFGIDMTAIRPTVVNTWHKSRPRPSELVTRPECWAVLDYAVLTSPHVAGDATWEIREPRTAHGIGAWFDWDGTDGVTFSNSPLSGERHIFGQAFFPWPEPLDLCRGDEVRVQLRADAVGSEYVYGWETIVRGQDGLTKAAFHQSDFLGQVLSSERLRKLSNTFTPTLSEDGRIDQLILNRAAAGLRLEQIAREVSAAFPHRFAAWTDAQTRVGQLSERYSE
jgi:protein arginine N-methyltransferase 1